MNELDQGQILRSCWGTCDLQTNHKSLTLTSRETGLAHSCAWTGQGSPRGRAGSGGQCQWNPTPAFAPSMAGPMPKITEDSSASTRTSIVTAVSIWKTGHHGRNPAYIQSYRCYSPSNGWELEMTNSDRRSRFKLFCMFYPQNWML